MRLIDAEELYSNIVEKGQSSKRYKIGEFWELNGAELRDVIDNQPTVEAAPIRRGRWVHEGPRFKGGNDWMHCSECGMADLWMKSTMTPFCPNCGARMEGE